MIPKSISLKKLAQNYHSISQDENTKNQSNEHMVGLPLHADFVQLEGLEEENDDERSPI